MSKIIKPVSFNDKDPYEVRLLAHIAQQGKYATYVKRLIARDMEGLAFVPPAYYPPPQLVPVSAPGPVAARPAALPVAAKSPAALPDDEAMLDAISF